MKKIHASVWSAALKEYLDRTANMRQDHHKLLVSYQKPHKSISKDTVARWLKQELKLAGIDTSTFGAHSTRAASTSAAKAHNVDGPLKVLSVNFTTKPLLVQKKTLDRNFWMHCICKLNLPYA